MGYGSDGLTFKALRSANVARLLQFKNAKGEISHPDGAENWSITDWLTAVCGELGEAANIIKKIRRGDLTLEAARESIADELADVQTYLDLLALRCGIDLGAATQSKWNRISDRVGSTIKLHGDDWHNYD